MKPIRPSIALAVIAKNEEENITQFFDSIEGCFDEVHFTDTGSTDRTVEMAKARGAIIHHFDWIDDFAAARNAAFQHPTTDYICWLDLDDTLQGKDAFIRWRDEAMGLADYWLATYHYASDVKTGLPVCSFARERVIKRDLGMSWRYFVHEGILPISPYGKQVRPQYIPTWSVKHMRTETDMKKDRSRNLRLFEGRKDKLDPRMKYYYGKELFEAGKPVDAVHWLMMAASDPATELHDRTLAIQYAVYSYMSAQQWDRAIEVALTGVQLAPNRAEFRISIGDCYAKMGRIVDAIPEYAAARACINHGAVQNGMAGPIFSHEDAYGVYPNNQLAKVYAHLGQWDKAENAAFEAMKTRPNEETNAILGEISRVRDLTNFSKSVECDDIVISCPHPGPYEWDADIAKEKGVGGSETAAIHMAYWLHKLTGRPVKVFNERSVAKTIDGVEYIPSKEMPLYFKANKPVVHIAWRHNMKLTDAPTYFWCHDLMALNGEQTAQYKKLLCLSPFHSRYVQAIQGIPEEKIQITRNGIDPKRFMGPRPTKKPFKIVFPSSPDRGLDRAIRIMDRLIGKYPELELHVFYGFDNLRKFGLSEMADRLEAMVKDRPWIKYHGNVQQDVLAEHFKEASIWLHPANFIETFCITAIEMLCAGTYPITRRLGALQDTLGPAEMAGMATILDIDCETESQYDEWAKALETALETKAWERVSIDPTDYSWESVADEWLEGFLKLPNYSVVKESLA